MGEIRFRQTKLQQLREKLQAAPAGSKEARKLQDLFSIVALTTAQQIRTLNALFDLGHGFPFPEFMGIIAKRSVNLTAFQMLQARQLFGKVAELGDKVPGEVSRSRGFFLEALEQKRDIFKPNDLLLMKAIEMSEGQRGVKVADILDHREPMSRVELEI